MKTEDFKHETLSIQLGIILNVIIAIFISIQETTLEFLVLIPILTALGLTIFWAVIMIKENR